MSHAPSASTWPVAVRVTSAHVANTVTVDTIEAELPYFKTRGGEVTGTEGGGLDSAMYPTTHCVDVRLRGRLSRAHPQHGTANASSVRNYVRVGGHV